MFRAVEEFELRVEESLTNAFFILQLEMYYFVPCAKDNRASLDRFTILFIIRKYYDF